MVSDIPISDWMPLPDHPNLLARNMSYIKPLTGSIGPKQTKCELRDETAHCDFEEYVVMLTTTRTPDVPSGGVLAVKTRTCITWASSISTKILVATEVEWSGRSFIKGMSSLHITVRCRSTLLIRSYFSFDPVPPAHLATRPATRLSPHSSIDIYIYANYQASSRNRV